MQRSIEAPRAARSIDSEARKLQGRMRGRLIAPSDPAYEEKRHVYNALIDRRPRFIASCEDAGDVVAALQLGRDAGLEIAVRGGGHSAPGFGTWDGALVLDLSPMHGVHVDPRTSIAWVQGGATWGAVDHATHAFGLATPAGIISNTGVGGLTLGGGHGYLSRKYGLTIDNLKGADVVLHDGRLVHASDSENADLFWALRGGGGNFGVVVSFMLGLHPVATVHAGPTFWSLDDTPAVLRWYDELIAAAPRELYGFFAFLTVPPVEPFPPDLHGRVVCSVMWCSLDHTQARALSAAVNEPAAPLLHAVMPMPYPDLQRMFDPLYPPGYAWYWRGSFVNELSDQAIDLHLEHAAQVPTPLSSMHLYPVDGAVHDVPRDATAFSYRDARYSQVIVGVDVDTRSAAALKHWTTSYSDALRPCCSEGAYINFLMQEGKTRIRAAYRDNYDRLLAIKQRIDPDNVFHVNQNVDPGDPRA